MAYQNPPTWVNGEPPPLNDVNLNIISDDIRDHQSRILALENGGAASWKAPVGTIAELRVIDTTDATNYSNNTAIVVLGYYSAGDKAGARIYRFDRSSSVADNGGAIIAPDSGVGRWELENYGNDYRVTHFGAKGQGNSADAANDRTAIQACVDWIEERYLVSGGGAGIAIFDQGDYYIDQTINITSRCGIRGTYGMAGSSSVPVRILWAGSAGGTMFSLGVDDSSSRWLMPIERVFISGGTTRPNYGFYFLSRVDEYARLRDISGSAMDANWMYFKRGCLNVHIKDFRADDITGYDIYALMNGSDLLTLEDFTTDNGLGGGAGTLLVDASNAPDNAIGWYSIKNSRIEVNSNYNAGEASLFFKGKTTVTQRTQFHGTIENVSVVPGAGVTSFDGLKVSPATDFVVFEIKNSQLSVSGIPYYAGSKIGDVNNHALTVIAPHSAHIGSDPEADQMAVEIAGLTNFLGPVYADGLQAQPWHQQAASALPAGATVYKGYAFYDASALTTGATSLVVSVCVDPGTVGTLSGVTASGTSGQVQIKVNTVAGLRLGQYLSIAGANTGVRIMEIDADTNTVYIKSALSASITGAALSYKAPTYKTTTLTLT